MKRFFRSSTSHPGEHAVIKSCRGKLSVCMRAIQPRWPRDRGANSYFVLLGENPTVAHRHRKFANSACNRPLICRGIQLPWTRIQLARSPPPGDDKIDSSRVKENNSGLGYVFKVLRLVFNADTPSQQTPSLRSTAHLRSTFLQSTCEHHGNQYISQPVLRNGRGL